MLHNKTFFRKVCLDKIARKVSKLSNSVTNKNTHNRNAMVWYRFKYVNKTLHPDITGMAL